MDGLDSDTSGCRGSGVTAVFDFEEMRPRKKRRLGNVDDRTGRLDVLLYQLASRGLTRLEREQGLAGLCENLLPIVEDAIIQHVPGRNLIPREIVAVLRIYQANRGIPA
jgi:hypothetical protein